VIAPRDKGQAVETALEIPPQNIEAEAGVLGSMLFDKDAVPAAMAIVSADDFFRTAHAHLFGIVTMVFGDTGTVDTLLVRDEIERRGFDLGDIMAEVMDDTPSAANVEHYADIVKEASLRRQGIEDARLSIEAFRDGAMSATKILDDAEERNRAISMRATQDGPVLVLEAITPALDYLGAMGEGGLQGPSTGLRDLDEITRGLPVGLTVPGGRPSEGKTALMLGIARHNAVDRGAPVAFFSLETTKAMLAARMICAQAGVNPRSNFDVTAPAILEAARQVGEAPIYIDDRTRALGDIVRQARLLHDRHGVGLIFVDYLQLVTVESTQDARYVQVGTITSTLKAMAVDLGVPIVGAAQLNRESANARDRRPRLEHLRESGNLEQDADLVIAPYHHADGQEYPCDEQVGVAEIIVLKQKDGPRGSAVVGWDASTFTFGDLRYEDQDAYRDSLGRRKAAGRPRSQIDEAIYTRIRAAEGKPVPMSDLRKIAKMANSDEYVSDETIRTHIKGMSDVEMMGAGRSAGYAFVGVEE
jgi:replicative DNA helicase